MMRRVQVVDVTLRDGGYRNQFSFSLDTSAEVIGALDQVGLDYIEFTLRLPEPNFTNTRGENSFLQAARKSAPRAKLAVMGLGGQTTPADIQDLKACGMDLVRIVIGPTDADPAAALALISAAKACGLEASANFSFSLHWTPQAMEEMACRAVDAGADILYIADSLGSMTPDDVKSRGELLRRANPKHFGFHGHDNIGMALLNSITAMEMGADFIDGSLRGMGNSSGNLKTEILLIYLNKMQGTHYDLARLLALADQFEQRVPEARPIHLPRQIMLGCLDLEDKIEDMRAVAKMAREKQVTWFDAVSQFARDGKSPRR